MISDTLHDAAHEIRRYLNAAPEAFASDTGTLADIFALLTEMDRIRAKLDRSPARAEPQPGLSIGWPGAHLGIDGKFY